MKKFKPFTLLESFVDGEAALNQLLNQTSYESIYLVGQSWGTVVAMPLIEKYRFKKIILITPFITVPHGEPGEALVKNYSKLYPDLLRPELLPQLISEFNEIATERAPMSFLMKTSFPKTIFAAERDETVPISLVEKTVITLSHLELIILRNEPHVIEDKNKLATLFRSELELRHQ